jgi:hypothetical protein
LSLFFVPRGFGHARHIHFLFNTSKGRLIEFPRRLVFVAMLSDVKRSFPSTTIRIPDECS